MVQDPFCGMQVNPDTTPYKSIYRGQTYYFCESACKTMFDLEPQKYTLPSLNVNTHTHQE